MKRNLPLLITFCMFLSCAKNIDQQFSQQQDSKSLANLHRLNTEFNKLYGGSSDDYIRQIIKGNNGYIFTGETYSDDNGLEANHGFGDIWVTRLDESGQISWQKAFGGTNFERGYSIARCENDYIIAGSTFSIDGNVPDIHGGGDAFVLKIDENGNLLDKKILGGSGMDEIVRVLPDGKGNFILVGTTQSNDGDVTGGYGGGDIWVLKMDAGLNILWQKTLGGSQFDAGSSLAISKDGSYIISGFTSSTDGDVKSNNGDIDFWVVNLSENGQFLWEHTYGGTGFDVAYSMTESVDGGYLVVGLTTSSDGDITVRKGGFVDGWMLKIDKDGNKKWDKTVGGSGFESCLFSITTHNGDYLIGGNASGNDGDFAGNKGETDGWIMRLDKQGKEKWIKVTGGSSYENLISACAGNFENYIIAGTSNSNDSDVSGNHGFTDSWVFTLNDK